MVEVKDRGWGLSVETFCNSVDEGPEGTEQVFLLENKWGIN